MTPLYPHSKGLLCIIKFVLVGFEVFTAATMKNAVFLNVAPCGSCKIRRFRGMYRHHLQGRRNIRERVEVLDVCSEDRPHGATSHKFVLTDWHETRPDFGTRGLSRKMSSVKGPRNKKKNSMVSVRERTIPTERPPLVGEVIANFCGYRVPRGQRDESLRPFSRFSRQEPLLFYQVAPQLYSRG
jgi:hypothetical protein